MTAVIAVLIVVDLVLIDQARWTVAVALTGTVALLLLARRVGLTRADLGLAPERVGAGLRWGGALSAVILSAYAVAAFLPALESAFDDERTPHSLGAVVLKVLVVIPLRTVLLEEVAFRGVIWALVRRRHGHVRATALSSALFGLWHVPIAVVSLRTNDGLASFSDSVLGGVAVVVTIVIAMTVAGVVLAELRRRTDSLVAPALVHWTVNSAGTVIGAAQHALS